MGEVVVCGGGGDGGSPAAATTGNVVRWEKFLPRMVFRVLLVEADDSTRHIITALLKKCNYKVAAVSDGLKAWEVLKERAKNIDLILTEMELPSVSGFALLTLIMEHEICKNIPVIMMSAHDSVSTVYKCMLRGAVDFLLKPLRKNELKNLWQHVWRRKTSIVGVNGCQEESDAQQKVVAAAENNETNNSSSGYMACIERNRECIEKGSDAQSSCIKLDNSEGSQAKDLQHSQWAKSPQKFEEYDKTQNQSSMQDNEADGTSAQEKDMAKNFRWERVNVIVDAGNHSTDAIDLIGSFDSYPNSSLNNGPFKVDHPSPLLDLPLRRSHPSSSVSQLSDERHMLKQSDPSAFSRYINRTQPSLPSGSPSVSNQYKDKEFNCDKVLSMNAIEYNFDCHSMPGGSSQQNTISQLGQTESQSQSQFASSYGRTLSRLNSIDSASNGHGNLPSDGNNTHRSIQREAALNKFRMKRKDRCFEKKVRYESRKKLAEQRPRVKGQFVRQTQASNYSPMEADTEYKNSSAS